LKEEKKEDHEETFSTIELYCKIPGETYED
jgi:hypothetical protein